MSDDFGVCPVCLDAGILLNVHKEHWMVCHAHAVRWHVGSNLFSGWMHEPEKKWRRNLKLLTGYKIVKPWIPVETHAMTATITTIQQQQALDFMRALHLANSVDPDATAAVMNSFHPSDKTDVNTAYTQLLKIAQSAVDAVLIKPAANDD